MKKIIIVVVALIILLIAGTFITYKILTGAVSNNSTEKEVTIPLGSSATSIAKILKENNLIKSEVVFKAL